MGAADDAGERLGDVPSGAGIRVSVAGLLIAFGMAVVAIAILRRSPLAGMLADLPNERSLHAEPTPRVGGLGLLAGALPVAANLVPGEIGWIVAIAAGLAVVSAVDDARSLPVALRLACHFTAAAVAAFVIVPPADLASAAGVAVAVLAGLAVAWMANLFNFMDGADGLAGGMSTIGFAAFSVAAARGGAPDVAMLAAVLAAASLGFLLFNFPPARVFMGDAGSVPLGFFAAAMGWLGVVRGAWPAWFPLLVFSPFIVDATATLLRRLAAREPVWRAHRSHYYQRLVLGGWSHKRLAVLAWLLMAAASASALIAREGPVAVRSAILLTWVVAYGALAARIDSRHPRRKA
jgi:UDP-N-acetylmuramyl pentapeptide phosphotransferase/UDP-N-acetylglucosamine-1-phosphate transferase